MPPHRRSRLFCSPACSAPARRWQLCRQVLLLLPPPLPPPLLLPLLLLLLLLQGFENSTLAGAKSAHLLLLRCPTCCTPSQQGS